MKNWEYYKDDIKRYGVDRFAIKKMVQRQNVIAYDVKNVDF